MKLKNLVCATMLAASSAAMAAAPQGPGTVTLTNTSSNFWSASIGDTPALGAFTDVFTFTPSVTAGSTAYGSLVNTSFFGLSNISFTSAYLNSTSLITSSLPVGFVTYNFATLLPSTFSGPLTLTVNGINTGGGSYGGDINVTMAPVPEPATYGMLLGGLALLGFAASRKKNS